MCTFYSSYSQTWERGTSLNLNQFYVVDKERLVYEFENKFGFDREIGLSNVIWNEVNWKFLLGVSSYSGSAKTIVAAQSYSIKLDSDVRKYIVYFGLYPCNYEIKKKVIVNIGAEFSFLLYQKMNGVYRTFHLRHGEKIYDLKREDERFRKKLVTNGALQIGYKIKLNSNLHIIPTYSFRIGIQPEFNRLSTNIYSMRHGLGVRISK